MTDNQIKTYLEYIKDSRYGKGGFEVKLSQYDILYDDNAILSYFSTIFFFLQPLFSSLFFIC